MSRTLPARPNLESDRKRAKALKKAQAAAARGYPGSRGRRSFATSAVQPV